MIAGPGPGTRPDLARRLVALRATRSAQTGTTPRAPARAPGAVAGARGSERLAATLVDAVAGRLVTTARGTYVRVDTPSIRVPLDRGALAVLPGLPPPDVPLVCLDTETTGLATAAGTVAFLVGFGTWRGERFDQVQLLLPDQPDEPALLDAIAGFIPPDAWLVTYNGRGFDWPLLVARYRLARRDAPAHAGHLDLLSFVRRIFRHRLPDARLRTVERRILALERRDDVEGWEIPRRYLDFLDGGSATSLEPVVRHNRDDVRALARLLALVATELGDAAARRTADPDDLAALARVYARSGRHAEAYECLDAAFDSPRWTPRTARSPWTADDERRRAGLALQRARALRRLGRQRDALEAWHAIAAAGGPYAAVAWIELAKSLEHRAGDPEAALDAALRALAIAERARSLGRPLPRLEADVAPRLRRLRRRVARRALARAAPRPAPSGSPPVRSAWRTGRPGT